MKRNIIIFFTIELFLTLGCEKLPVGNAFLAKAPGVDVTKDTIFNSLEYAERFLWGAYRTLPFGLDLNETAKGNKALHGMLEQLTDLDQNYLYAAGVPSYYYSGAYNSEAQQGSSIAYNLTTEGSFDGIRRSYIFIENIDRVPDADPDYIKRLKSEARMIIAIHYSDMYRYFGGMPWINHSYSVTNEMIQLPRLTAQATCDSIVALCDKAAVDLPWAIDNLEEWDGRFTKAGAMGLKARMLLFDASPLYNASTPFLDGEASQLKLTWHGGYDANLWKKAMDAAHDLITQVEAGSDYKIYHKAGNSYRQDFQDGYYRRGTGETLISVRESFLTGSWIFYSYYPLFGGVTNDYVEMFPMANGLPITDPLSGYNPADPYVNRDPRLYESVVVNGDKYKGRTAELWIGGLERLTLGGTQNATGYGLKKFELDINTETSRGSIMQWPYLRLPEIYLSYAEASNEFNNGPDAEAYRCVNIVRNRVGLGNLPAGLTKEQFREAILTERACEFGWEEVRWFDLIRWKRENDFKKHLHGMNIYRSATAPYTYTYTKFELPVRYWMQVWSPKWYLSAFPLNEVNKGYGLVQNPGW